MGKVLERTLRNLLVPCRVFGKIDREPHVCDDASLTCESLETVDELDEPVGFSGTSVDYAGPGHSFQSGERREDLAVLPPPVWC